jgi:hypothetical protein
MRDVAAAYHMGEEETERFLEHPIARLIAALPYVAGCERPARTAAVHLGTYVLSVRDTRHLFYATESDDRDVFARLEPIARFDGGDPAIIEKGMAIIALNMVTDYRRDRELDAAVGKHNPVTTGAWDSDSVIEALRRRIAAVSSPQLDTVLSGGDGTESYWAW